MRISSHVQVACSPQPMLAKGRPKLHVACWGRMILRASHSATRGCALSDSVSPGCPTMVYICQAALDLCSCVLAPAAAGCVCALCSLFAAMLTMRPWDQVRDCCCMSASCVLHVASEWLWWLRQQRKCGSSSREIGNCTRLLHQHIAASSFPTPLSPRSAACLLFPPRLLTRSWTI